MENASLDVNARTRTSTYTHTHTHTHTHCSKKPYQVPWPHHYKQSWPPERTKREYRKRATTHIWFVKEEARMSFLGNELQNKRREKRKHACGYWRGSVRVCVCVCAHALCTSACVHGCVLVRTLVVSSSAANVSVYTHTLQTQMIASSVPVSLGLRLKRSLSLSLYAECLNIWKKLTV